MVHVESPPAKGSNVVGIEIIVEVKPEKRSEFMQAAAFLGRRRSDPEADVVTDVYEKCGNPNRFMWVERLDDTEQLKRRLDSESFHALLGAIRVLGTVRGLQLVESREWSDVGRITNPGTANDRGTV